MIFLESELVSEVDKYFDSNELADRLDDLADELGSESAYWLKESAINLRVMLEICVSFRFYQMMREHEKKYGPIGATA